MAFEIVKQFEKGNTEKITEQIGLVYQGYLIGRREVEIGDRKSWIYTLLKEDGKTFEFWGFTGLDMQMPNIPDGVMVKLTYQGKKKTKRGMYAHSCDIQIDRENVVKPA